MAAAALPLGIDIGTTRLRMAVMERASNRGVRLAAAGACDLPDGTMQDGAVANGDLLAAAVEQVWRELGTRQRRCVMALPAGAAVVKLLRFPAMSWSERRRCAAFEAERFAPWAANDAATIVRVHPHDRKSGVYAVGIARKDALHGRAAAIRRAGLRPVAADSEAWALRRSFSYADAVLDVGCRRSTLHAFSAAGISSQELPMGGIDVTRAIASDLAIGQEMAEKRKRILGTAGAGDSALREFAVAVAGAVESTRGRSPVRTIALTGNGARLPGLGEAIAQAAQAIADLVVCDLLRDGAYPDDVARAAAPDWTLAAALAASGGKA